MKENNIEDRINKAYCFLNSMYSDFRTGLYYKEDLENLEHILSDYKKLKEEFKAVDHECSRLERKEVEMEKIIDLIIKDLYKQAHISTRCYLQISIEECMKNKNCIECLKQYFINNAKEVK